jgi:putative DNA primase/helicase
MLDFSKIEDWAIILTRCFGINPEYLVDHAGPCPICGGRDRFRYDDIAKQGTWFCQQCGPGNGFTLVKKVTGMSDYEVLSEMEKFIPKMADDMTYQPIIRPQGKILTPEEIARNRTNLNETWNGGFDLDGHDPISMYLLSRVPRLNLDHLTGDFRAHRSLTYFERVVTKAPGADGYRKRPQSKWVARGNWFAMLARIRNGAGVPINLHRTYLTKDGTKAPFDDVKKQMSGTEVLNGGSISLNHVPESRVLGAVEGIETGLAVLTGYRNRINVKSFINALNLSKASVSREHYDKVIFFADHDKVDRKHGYRPGEHYALIGMEKLKKEGFEVEIRIPPNEGQDYADVWKQICDAADAKAASEVIRKAASRESVLY